MQPQTRLQPQLLKQLRALTALTFSVLEDSADAAVLEGDTLDIPELRVLVVEGYWARHLQLECPKLISLEMADCDPMGPVLALSPPDA